MESNLLNLWKWWAVRDLNPRLPPCEDGNHAPRKNALHYQEVNMSQKRLHPPFTPPRPVGGIRISAGCQLRRSRLVRLFLAIHC
jgi:hypothetical protein